MSTLMPSVLRYIKRSQLEEEHRIMANYYQDIIRAYGIDVLYIKRDSEFKISGINSDSIYGHQDTVTYALSADMITFMEVDSSMLALNGLGLVPQDEVTFYFSINDFSATFANDISQYAEYIITPLSGYLPYSTTIINKTFTSDILDGTISYNTSGALSGEHIFVEPTTVSLPLYSISVNPYLHTSFSSTISGSYVGTNLFLTYNKGLYKGCNRLFYSLSGYVLYSDLTLALKHTTKIKPNVGDIVRLDFPGNEQLEEYEISEVLSRKPTTDGVNPLLGKYVWKCKATRRIASHENIINSDIQAENATEDLMDLIKKSQHDINTTFKEINDFSTTKKDDVYGGYDIADNLINDPDRYALSGALSGTSVLQDFNNNSSLITDGADLYYQHGSVYTNITNNVSGNTYTELTFPINVTDIMYLKIKDNNIYFTSSEISGESYISNKITNFAVITKKEQYSFDYIIKDVNNKYNLNNSSTYIFKSDRFAIFSTGSEVKAVNAIGDEYTIV